MRVEEIVIHCLIFLANIAIYALLFKVWKYLNSKSLGFQTVLDDLAKDGMILLALTLTYNWIVWIKFYPEYNYYVAMIIINVGASFRVSLIVQALTFSITRYLFVLNFSHINNVAEGSIKMASRIFLAVLSITCGTVDDWTGGKKFLYLTDKDKDQVPKSPTSLVSIIVAISSLLIIVYIQARISYAKWKYPEIYNNNEDNETYNLKIISVVTGILIVVVIIVLSFLFAKIDLWKSLLTLLCLRIIVLVAILLFIYSNPHLFSFVKNNLKVCQGDPFIQHTNPAPNDVSIENPFIIPQPIHASSNSVQSENPFVIPQPVPRSTEGIEIPSVSYSLHLVDRNRSFH